MPRYFNYKTALFIFFVSLISYLVIVLGVIYKTDVLSNLTQGSRYIRYILLELLLIVPLWLYVKVNKKSLTRVFRMRKLDKLHFPLLLLIAFGMFFFFLGIEYISYVYKWCEPLVNNEMLVDYNWNLLILIPLSGIITPLVEEAVFRGFIFRVMLDRKYSKCLIIIVSSLLFASVHLNLLYFPRIFISGIILGYIAYFFHSIIPSVIIHSIFNMLALFEINLPQLRELFINNSKLPYLLLGIGLLMFVAGMLGVKKKVHIKHKRKEKGE